MMRIAKTFLKTFGILVSVLVILIGIFSIWFYSSPASNFKNRVASMLPFPAAFVGGHPVYIKDVLRRNNLDQLVQQQQVIVVADKYGISVGKPQLDGQFNLIKQQTPNFSSLVNQNGLTEAEFKTSVLKPELLYTNVRVWYNGERSLNKDVYSLADSIKQQLSATSATSSLFSDLAARYSQDEATKNMGGDLGFVNIGSLWPEFQSVFDSMSVGDARIVPGRDGVYIFQIMAKDNNGPNNSLRAETREIYLQTSGFQEWYANETKNIKIIKL